MSTPPLVGITCNVDPPSDVGLYRGQPLDYGDRSIAEGVARAGGLPLLVPVCAAPGAPWATVAQAVLARLDALFLGSTRPKD